MPVLDQTENFVRVLVDGAHTDTDTTISLQDGGAEELPDPSEGEYNMVWWNATRYQRPDADTNVEIVRVTDIDTDNDTVTVDRGRENTSASAKDREDEQYVLHLATTSKMFEDIQTAVDEDLENFSTSGGEGTVPVSQGDGTLAMQGIDAEGGFTAAQSLIELNQDEMIQIARFTAPTNTKVEVFGGSVSDENGDSVVQETEVELFDHTTDETLFVIDESVLQQGEPLFEESVGGDELEFRLVNATDGVKNLSGKILFDIVEV